MRRVLFVDDEPRVLQGLRRMLRGMRDQWDMEFVSSAEEALGRVAVQPFDVVVSDMRMPAMDGAQLLARVREASPSTVRIVLSGHSDREAVMRTVGVAHQFLTKPSDSDAVRATILRACRLRDRLRDPWHCALVSRVAFVPSSPSARAALSAELESAEPSVQRVGRIVSRDVGLSTRLLQLVSSGFFGPPQISPVPADWTALLGLDTIRRLLRDDIAEPAAARDAAWSEGVEMLTAHSLRVAACAKALAESDKALAARSGCAYLAGLLHDVGLFVLADHAPERWSQMRAAALSAKEPAWRIEQARYGVTHADLGGYLLALWGVPDVLVEAAAGHHAPGACPEAALDVLTAVHVADAAALAAEMGVPVESPFVDREYLGRIGCAERLGRWCQLCREAIS
jgi:HD-like signal output (HDOD) protein